VTIKRRNASQENAVGKRLGRTGFGFVIAERRATPAPHYKQRLTKEKRQVLQVIAVNHCKKIAFRISLAETQLRIPHWGGPTVGATHNAGDRQLPFLTQKRAFRARFFANVTVKQHVELCGG
jgi:hypothetical protein